MIIPLSALSSGEKDWGGLNYLPATASATLHAKTQTTNRLKRILYFMLPSLFVFLKTCQEANQTVNNKSIHDDIANLENNPLPS
jgi:hypothetical protein